MKFFTPELYLQYNAADERDADRAEEAWEHAIGAYKSYLKGHRAKMPPSVRTLAEKCCFHDAVLLGWQTHDPSNSRRSPASPMLTLGLQHGHEMIVLCYFLSGSTKESKRRKNWAFSPEHKHWLYDEVAMVEEVSPGSPCDFVHRVLWSDGSELEIPFMDVIIDRFPAFNLAAV